MKKKIDNKKSGMVYEFDESTDMFCINIQVNMGDLREVELVKGETMHVVTKDLLNKENPISQRISAIATIFSLLEHWKAQARKPALADFHSSFRKIEGKNCYFSPIPIIKRLSKHNWDPYSIIKKDISNSPIKNVSWIYNTYKEEK